MQVDLNPNYHRIIIDIFDNRTMQITGLPLSEQYILSVTAGILKAGFRALFEKEKESEKSVEKKV